MSFKSLFLSLLIATGFGVAQAQSVTAESVAQHYGSIVHATYEDSLTSALQMQADIDRFLAVPSATALAQARTSWIAAREWYGQTEAFRFYGGPIDGENGPEGRVNAWPMDESFVDSVVGRADSGLVNNLKIALTRATLTGLNEKDGEENIATGWHAIEFMLWGQDLSVDGPGNRAFTDFVDGQSPNADRRREYLRVITALLIDDLKAMNAAWQPNVAYNYRGRFVKAPQEALRLMIVGLGSLSRGELAGERLEVALHSQDQEDEHSCFSDNTHRDVVNNALGIQNVWTGTYVRLNGQTLKGASLAELVAQRNPELAQSTTQAITTSVKEAQAITPPFDRAISNPAGKAQIQKVIASLLEQSKGLVSSASALGIRNLTLVQP